LIFGLVRGYASLLNCPDISIFLLIILYKTTTSSLLFTISVWEDYLQVIFFTHFAAEFHHGCADKSLILVF